MRELESELVQPGRKYTVLVRSAARKAFFSAPLIFNVAFPKPKKVHAYREDDLLTVTWDFPSKYSTSHFLVTVESIYDRLQEVQVKRHTCTFKMDAQTLSENLDVMVYAISDDNITSAPASATFISHPPNESTRTMSPGMETCRGSQDLPRPTDVSPVNTDQGSGFGDYSDTDFMGDTWGDEPDNLVDYLNETTATRESSGSVQVRQLFYDYSPPANCATRFK